MPSSGGEFAAGGESCRMRSEVQLLGAIRTDPEWSVRARRTSQSDKPPAVSLFRRRNQKDVAKMMQFLKTSTSAVALTLLLLCLSACRVPEPANPIVIRVTIPAGYQGALLLVVDPDCVSEGYDFTHLDFSQSPILCVPSLRPFEDWHTHQAADTEGVTYDCWSPLDPNSPGELVIVEGGTVVGTRVPLMATFYVGDPLYADAPINLLGKVEFSEIRKNPWLLRRD
jgi:hypothetical protein